MKISKAERVRQIRDHVVELILKIGTTSASLRQTENARHLELKLWRWKYGLTLPSSLDLEALYGPTSFRGKLIEQLPERKDDWVRVSSTFCLDIWGPDLKRRIRTGNKIFSLHWNYASFDVTTFIRGPWEDAVLSGAQRQ